MGGLTNLFRATCALSVCVFTTVGAANSFGAAGIQVLTPHNPVIPLAIPGNGSSGGPIFTPDGRYVVFVSAANDLVPGDNNLMMSDVFVRDRLSGITTLVSTNINGTGGGNSNSFADAISTDGRFVLFEGDSTDLVPGDTNGVNDIFVRDLFFGTTTLVSASTNGTPGNGASSSAAFTPDGRFVVFVSYANNLVAGDTNGISDVFVRDLLAGSTTLASPGAIMAVAGTSNVMSSPVITPDGRFVAFASSAKNLAGGVSTFQGDVYVRDLQAGTTTWISTNNPGANYASSHPVISDDGRYVAFKQKILNKVNGYVFRYDALTGANTEINTNLAGVSLTNSMSPQAFVDDVLGPEMTPDGRFVYYVGSSNLTSGAIYQWDSQTLTNAPVSVDTNGAVVPNTSSHTPVISADNHFLAFLSNGTNLGGNVVSNGFHLYIRDLQLGTNYLVDVDTNGVGARELTSIIPSMTADGNLVAFSALDAGFVSGDNNQARDVFIRNMTNGSMELVSVRNPSVSNQTGGNISWITQASITPDGRFLVFTSRADDLVTNDFNNEQDVFVRDLVAGANILVSVGTNGVSPLGGASGSPSITPDGRYVAFVTAATNMVAGDSNNAADLYIRDLQTSTTIPAFVAVPFSGPGTGDVVSPVMSSDARYVAFLTRTNSTTFPFWRDILSNRTVQLTNVSSSFPPSISTNGRYVAFSDSFPHVVVRDMVTSNNIYTSPSTASGGSLSPDGSKVAFGLTVVDIGANSNIVSFSGVGTTARNPSQWSANNRYVVMTATTALIPNDANFGSDVYLCDLQTKTLTRVSDNSSHTGSGNSISDNPSITGDGRFVVFRSFATDIVPGVTNAPNIYVFDRLTGSNTLISVESSPLPSWTSSVGSPGISSDGSTIVFQSTRARYLPGTLDINRNQDLFATGLVPLSFTDSDGDGIPDWWLNQYFGHPNGQAGDLSRAQDDADGDGMSNLQEFLTGTIPTNPSSVLKVQITSIVAGGNITLTWPALPGKSYKLQFKNNANDPAWQDVPASVLVGASQASITISTTFPSPATNRFYQVVAVN